MSTFFLVTWSAPFLGRAAGCGAKRTDIGERNDADRSNQHYAPTKYTAARPVFLATDCFPTDTSREPDPSR